MTSRFKESNSNIKASSYQEENDAAYAINCMHIEKGKKSERGYAPHNEESISKIARPYKDNGFANAKGMFSIQLTYKIKLKQIN